ncbi:MAG: hypothetical protein LBK63_06900 [Treponema sp.]|jgi:hypothetical protein|nr:hypothetical protein [Treponema sp.]
MNYKVGDTVRIQSKEWMDTQEKDEDGFICKDGNQPITTEMQEYAGKVAKIMQLEPEGYVLNIDNGDWVWDDFMFDPDYRPEDEPLSSKDAILAMMNKEVLYNKFGESLIFDEERGCFARMSPNGAIGRRWHFMIGLHRRPAKSKRTWTRWEILAWVNSDESRGWLVRSRFIGDAGFWRQWELPQRFSYDTCEGMADDGLFEYQRARLLLDHSGIDESSIQGFEAEE